ncbi:4-amino-4-deoxy-L-arabinose transferase [Mariniphaga anaerophila]|uniref:4-amino-4-deoxy-L-arabinose transferase n=1 Tax=Mariniphaga anaerophila TaxID=1484053 RepID=A0A1M5ABE6_9BACT|nr:glycosyltransferase family 39 protein [Mariniphaga anaerophila]SHF27618.1 4-amino-4-deoxy-L-arabinose transferase [Mariniphaga anaerophila]
MLENRTIKIIFFALTGLALAIYFSGLSIDVTRDAGKYATVSKEVFQNGNFINLTIHGEPYDQKPPLLFWVGALGFSIGGISNFWFKFPVLLLVFLGFYSAYGLGRSLYNRRVGLLTAFMLAFSLIYTLYSMDIHTDTPLQVFITFALWQLSEFIQTKRNKNWILGFIGIGFAMLSKGPIGAAIPAFAVVGHILLKKDFRFLKDYRWYAGILLAFVIVSPALIGLINQFGWDGIVFFFWDNNVGRLTGTYVKPNHDPIFYVHNLLYLFLPWSLLFFASAFMELKTLISNKFKTSEYFTFTGIWIFFIILNASRSQLPNYIFGIVPLIAVLTAKWVDIALLRKSQLLKVFRSIQAVVVAMLWVAVGIIALYLFPIPEWQATIIALLGLTATIYIFRKSKTAIARLILPSAIAFACLAWLLNTDVFPYIFSYQAPPKAARFYNENAAPGEKLYNFHYSQFELFFYSEPQAEQLSSNEEMKAVAGKKGNWIFTDDEGFQLISALKLEPDTVIEYQHLYLNRGGRFINPKTRHDVLQPMYLIKY